MKKLLLHSKQIITLFNLFLISALFSQSQPNIAEVSINDSSVNKNWGFQAGSISITSNTDALIQDGTIFTQDYVSNFVKQSQTEILITKRRPVLADRYSSFPANTKLTKSLEIKKGSKIVLDQSILKFTNAIKSPTVITYNLNKIPTNGVIKKYGVQLNTGDSFNQLDINSGVITYKHNGNSKTSDSFVFDVNDGSDSESINNIRLNISIGNSTKGVTYYVSSTSGDDNNDGLSEVRPWKTLHKVSNANIKPGDSILFKKNNTFKGQLKPNYSGKKGSSITFSSYGSGKKPIITGSWKDSGGDYLSAVLINNQEYFNLHNLEIRNNRKNSIKDDNDDNKHDDKKSFGIFVLNNGKKVMHGFNFSNLTIRYIYPITILSDSNQVAFNSIKIAGIYLRSEKNKVAGEEKHIKNVTLSNSFFTQTGKFGFWSQHAGGSKGIGNDSINRNMNYVLKNNKFLHTGGSGITPGGTYNLLIEGNVFDYPGSKINDKMVGRGSGAWLFNCRNVIAQYNKSYHARGSNDSYGMHIDSRNKYVIFQYNYSEDNEGFVEILGDNLYATYRFNISVNDGQRKDKGNTFWFSDYAGSRIKSDSLWVYNNSVFVNTKNSEEVFLKPGLHLISNDALIANNSLYVKQGAHMGYKQFDRSNSVQIDHNLYYGDIRKDNFSDQDANAIYSNPLYLNPGALNANAYKLETESPAIKAGRAIIEPPFPEAGKGIFSNITARATLDYYGNPVNLRQQGTNIGAYNGKGIKSLGNNKPPSGETFEAEEASLSGGLEIAPCKAYSGGFATKPFKKKQNKSLTFNYINTSKKGVYDITIYYLSPTNRVLNYSINSESSISIDMPSTGNFCYEKGKIKKYTLKLILNAGINTLTFSSAPFIDKITMKATSYESVFEAENAVLRGKAIIVSCDNASKKKMVSKLNNGPSNSLTFKNIPIAEAGNFNIVLNYFSKKNSTLNYQINSAPPKTISVGATGQSCYQGGSPGSHTFKIKLPSGYNNIKFYNSPIIDKIKISPIIYSGTWEAESAILSGTAKIENCTKSSGGKIVKNLSGGATNAITFKPIYLTKKGKYNLTISYITNKKATAKVEINGTIQNVSLPSSGKWCQQGGKPAKHTIMVRLKANNNKIKIYDSPPIDKIMIVPNKKKTPRIFSNNSLDKNTAKEETELLVYPNSIDRGQDLNIKINGTHSNQKVTISVLNMLGTIVIKPIEKKSSSFKIPTHTLKKRGIYLLKTKIEGKTIIKQLVVK